MFCALLQEKKEEKRYTRTYLRRAVNSKYRNFPTKYFCSGEKKDVYFFSKRKKGRVHSFDFLTLDIR